MTLPRLTHLQFLVVSHLMAGIVRGSDLRARLRQDGVKQSAPAFYQMMAVLEDAELVSGWYEQRVIDGQIVRERHYKVMASGRRAAQASRDFYRRTVGGPRLAFEG